MALNARANNANLLNAAGAFASAIATTSQLSWTGITGTNATVLMGGAIDISGASGGILLQSGQTVAVTINNGSAAALSLGNLGIDMLLSGANLTIGPTGGQITLFNASTPMNVGTGRTLTISSAVTGAGFNFSKSGAGISLLSGANNGMTGLFTLNGGSVQIGNAGALGGATATLALVSGTLSSSSATGFTVTAAGASVIAGNVTLGSATLTGALIFGNAFDLGGTTRTLTIASAVTLNGAISNGGITKLGSSTLTLSGPNTFALGMGHSIGTLAIGNTTALGAGKLTWSGGTLSNTTGAFTISNAMDLSGTLTWSFNSGNLTQQTGAVTLLATTTFAGNINTLVINGNIGDGGNGFGIIRNSGIQSLQLGGANTFTGAVTVTTGAIRASSTTALGPATNTTDISVAAGATLEFFTGASATYTSRATKISGTGVAGAALLLSGSSITTTLAVTLQAASAISVSNTGTLAGTIDTTATPYALTAYTTTGQTGTVSAIISGGGSLTTGVSGFTGTTTLSGTNTFTGNVFVSFGTLSVTNASGLGSSATARALTVSSGATLTTALGLTNTNLAPAIAGTGFGSAGAIAITGNVTLTFGTTTLTAAATIRSTSTTGFAGSIDTNGFALTLTASASNFTGTYSTITGSGDLIVNSGSDVGTITLASTANSYTGTTTVSAGTLSVTGLLGSGSYSNSISVATASVFAFNSGSNQTLSGGISGAGSLQRTTGTGVLTLPWTNTLSTVALLGSGTTVVSTIGTVALRTSPLGTNTQISLGTGSTTGGLRYTGATLSTDKTFYLASTSTGGGTIESSGSGALTISSNLDGASSASTRTLTLRGTYGAVANEFSGNITNVGGGAGIIAVVIGYNTTPVQNSYWKLSGTNTFSAGLNVFSGIGEATSAGALGSGTVNVSSFTRNASLGLRFSGDTTVTNTITASANVWGGDAANSPLGFIRTVATGAAVTFSGTVTTSTIVGVYADQSDLTFSNTISTTSTFATRAASGRTITLSGGVISTGILTPIGPGKTVWKGANTSTAAPQLSGGTLSVVLDGTSTFANTSFGLGQSGTTTVPSQRYAFTGGVLEFDNVGATGDVSKTWSGSTSIVRGPATFRLKRTSTAGAFSVTIGTLSTGAALATVEYSGGGTVGTDSVFNASAVGSTSAAVNTWAPGLIISNGSTLVPAAWTASTSFITFPVYGTTTNFTTQGASSSGLTVATGTTQNVNVTDFITGQNTVAMRTVRLNDANSAIALNSGQSLYTGLLMDMGATPSRIAITGGTLGTSGNSGTLYLYTANTGGATIASAIDKRAATALGLNGTGSFIFSGAVQYLSALQHNSANATFNSTFALPFAGLTQSNPSESADAITMTLGSGAASLASLTGGGANTTLSLAGGDLTLTNYAGATSYYAGAITRNSTQKLIVKMYSVATQNLHGALSVPLEFVRGVLNIAPIYGATVTGAPTVTFSGNASLTVDMSGNTLNSDYSLTFGAMAANASLATVALSTSANGTYTNTLTFASLSQSGAGVVNFSATLNSQNLTVFSTPPTLVNNIVGAWAYTGTNGFATYRTSGTFTSNGSAVPVSGSIDYLNYGTDSNTTLIILGTPVPAASGSNNVSVTTAPITAQTSASAYTLRLATTMAVAAGQAFKTNAVLTTATGNSISGADATATLSTINGDLYFIGTGIHSIKVTDNGGTQTRVILSGSGGLTSTASDYTGGTLIYTSLAATTTDAMLGAASGSLTFNGATFAPSANFTTSRSISIVGAGLTFSHATGVTVALNGTLSGDGILRFITSGGATTISGSNSLSGFVNVGAGTITITNNAALGTTSEIDMAGGTLTFASGVTAFDSSRFSTRAATNYNINNSSGTAITFSAGFGNNSAFTKTGTSDIVLGGTNGLAAVVISAGALVVTKAFALGYGDSALAATTATGTSLVLRGSFTMPMVSTSAATRTYTILGSGYTAGGYNGALWADSGTVTVPGNITLSSVAATIGTGSTGGLILNGAVTLGSSLTLTTRVDGTGNIKMTGVISGTGTSGITKTGAEVLELAPAASSNTYTGTTRVSNGKLKLTSETPDTVLPVPSTSAVVLEAGTTIQTSTGTLQKGRVTLASLDNSAGGIIRIGG